MILDDYQLDAVANLKNGQILCGGVGSGKSITSLAWYYIWNGGRIKDGLMPDRIIHPSDLYIITTAKKRDSKEWNKELNEIGMNPDENNYKNRVIIDSWNNIDKYTDIEHSYFIFDEQRLVGKGAWVKAFYKIAAKNLWILLTATPGDKWEDYIPVFVANHFFKNRTEFVRRHIVYKYGLSFPVVDKYWDEKRLEALRDQLLVNMDYKLKAELHHEYVVSGYDRLLYHMVCKSRINPETEEPIKNVSEFCQCLRKICNSDVSRGNMILTITDRVPKVIIFYNYNYELEILKNLRYKEGTEIAEWNGKKHEQIPISNRWVYLVQYNAGAEGWNCIQTDTMIFYSDCYSYRNMEQASGRINRRNTPYNDLYYYHFRTTSNIDLAMRRTLEKKKNFNESSFGKKMNFK